MSELSDDPATMTPQQRRQEIAAILARGVLRLRQTPKTPQGSQSARTAEKYSEFRETGLEDSAKTSPHALVR